MNRCLTIIETRMEYFLQGVDADITSASFMSFILYLKDHYETWEEKIQTWVNAINLSKDRKEKWFTNLTSVGNIGSAAIYVALDELIRTKEIKQGQKILLLVPEKSGRFSYGTVLLTVD